MNTKHISLAFAVAAALLAGCAKSPVEEVKTSEQFTNLELAYVGATETKAAIDGTAFPTDGEIGLYLFKDEAAATPYGESGYTNVKYTYNSTKEKWTAAPSIKVGSTPGYLFGYYPYDSEVANIKAIPVTSSLNGDDVMYATPVKDVTDQTAAQTAITMNHALARVSITVKNNGYAGAAKLSKIKFSGAEIAPEGTLNALDGSVTATKSEVTLDVTGDAQTVTTAGTIYECLLVPSKAVDGKQTVTLTLTIDGEDKTATLSGNNGVIIAKGTKSNITIGLSNSGISVSSVSIDEWKEVEVGGHKVTVKLSEDAGIENDVYLNATTDGSSVTIKALTTLTGRFTQCTCTPAGKATCSPSIDAETGICTFTITDVQDDITAEVGYLKYNATVEYDSDMGSVKLEGVAVASGSPVQILYGEEAEFTAEANTGYGFVKWTDGSDKDLSTDNPYTISSVTSDITLKAIFAESVEISAEVKPAGAGTVMGAGIYANGSTATLTAIAGESFSFTGWAKAESLGTIISTDNPYEFTVSQSASYVAVFRLNDALSGVFTVAADDQGNPMKKVQFSKGNLYYNGATFNFEANQYDTTPSSSGTRVDNHISHFMWCKTPEKAMALKYDTNCNGETPFFAANDFTVNGYSGWSVLTGGDDGEWEYLLNKRKTKYGTGELSESNHRYAAVEVNGMAGLLLFPDDFSSWPSGAGTEPQTFNTNSSNWNGKDYTVAEFTVLQNNGCVFLPAAGFRYGDDGSANVNSVGNDGYYWSASPYDVFSAYDLYFNSGNVNPLSYDARYSAQSVRFVTESK